MSEAQTTTTENGGAKKAPATFHTILGEKVGMTQLYHPKDQNLYGVTIVKAGPCPVLRVKTADSKDGYNAVQLGFRECKEKSRSASPSLATSRKPASRLSASCARFASPTRKASRSGQAVVVDGAFKVGDYVDVQGISKGHGFAGVMKRHNFRGMPGSHGASDKERSPGSLASRRSLGRVLPGQRMAGHIRPRDGVDDQDRSGPDRRRKESDLLAGVGSRPAKADW